MIIQEECNKYLKSLEGKHVCLRWQETDSNNPNSYRDRFNIVHEIEIKQLFLDSSCYLVLNGEHINLNPKCYESINFDCERMEFNYTKGSISTTLSFRLK